MTILQLTVLTSFTNKESVDDANHVKTQAKQDVHVYMQILLYKSAVRKTPKKKMAQQKRFGAFFSLQLVPAAILTHVLCMT